MPRTRWILTTIQAAVLSLCMGMPAPARAADRAFGIFHTVAGHPEAIRMDGLVVRGSPADLRRALAADPDAKVLILDSRGGLVEPTVAIAGEVHRHGLVTAVPSSSQCYSSCSMVFFAGAEHIALGRLGVHQGTAVNAYWKKRTTDMVVDTLTRYGAPPLVLSALASTPTGTVHIFSALELTHDGIQHPGPILSNTVSAWTGH